jgi:KaiC/GvpD/RAD55 family RecA-like ATPase
MAIQGARLRRQDWEPLMITVHSKGVPTKLGERKQWIVWRQEKRGGELTKVPYNSFGRGMAKSNDPATWSTFEAAVTTYAASTTDYAGIGFVFSADDEFCGIDLDGCRDPKTRQWSDWARKIMLEFNTYTELSPSCTGAKMFVEAKSPLECGRKIKPPGAEKSGGKEPGIEVYDKLRYFAVTGRRVAGFPAEPQPRQSVLDAFCKEWFKPESAPRHVDFGSASAVIDRARAYVATMPISVSGQHGHDAAFKVACRLVLGFALSPEEAYGAFVEWNSKCQPPWSEREIRHKLKQADSQPGERGWLRNTQESRWNTLRVPHYVPPPPPPQSGTLHAAAQDYLKSIEGGNVQLLSLGLGDVDYAIGGGTERGEIVLIAGRPGHGKSAVGLQAAYSMAADNVPVLIISEEMGRLALGKRAIQYSTAVSQESWAHRLGQVRNDLEEHFKDRAGIHVVESCSTVSRAVDAIEQHVEEHKVGCVIVDYGQLLNSPGHGRYEQMARTSITLRETTNRHRLSMIVLAQMNREIEKRKQWIPQLSDLRDAGQWEQDADVILFLLWPHRLNPKNDPHEYVIFAAKNRSRAINEPVVKCRFLPSRQKIETEKSTSAHAYEERAEDAEFWAGDGPKALFPDGF